MAYDPYDRGDNPWIANLDMPRSNPTAKPGASRAASLSAPAKKKKPVDPELLDPSLRWTNGKITRDPPATGSVAPASPPRRPAPAPGGLPAIGPEAPTRPLDLPPPPRVTGPESTAPMGPPTGLLGPRPPGAMDVTRSPAEALQPLAPPDTPPPAQQIMNSAANNPTALRPTQTTSLDQTGAGIMDFIRSQLFNQGKPNPKFDPNHPSGAIY